MTLRPQHYRCTRCGHRWLPRAARKPVQCPRCHSPYWDRERKAEAHRRHPAAQNT